MVVRLREEREDLSAREIALCLTKAVTKRENADNTTVLVLFFKYSGNAQQQQQQPF